MTKMNEMSVNATVLSMSELENVNGGFGPACGLRFDRTRRKLRKR